MDCLSRGIGYCDNETHCIFPGDLDPGDETFDGVEFSLFEDSTIISVEELHNYIRRVCDEYLVEHPEDAVAVDELLVRLSAEQGD